MNRYPGARYGRKPEAIMLAIALAIVGAAVWGLTLVPWSSMDRWGKPSRTPGVTVPVVGGYRIPPPAGPPEEPPAEPRAPVIVEK